MRLLRIHDRSQEQAKTAKEMQQAKEKQKQLLEQAENGHLLSLARPCFKDGGSTVQAIQRSSDVRTGQARLAKGLRPFRHLGPRVQEHGRRLFQKTSMRWPLPYLPSWFLKPPRRGITSAGLCSLAMSIVRSTTSPGSGRRLTLRCSAAGMALA